MVDEAHVLQDWEDFRCESVGVSSTCAVRRCTIASNTDVHLCSSVHSGVCIQASLHATVGDERYMECAMVACTASASKKLADMCRYLPMETATCIRMPVVKENLQICITEKGNSRQAETSLVRLVKHSGADTILVFCCEMSARR